MTSAIALAATVLAGCASAGADEASVASLAEGTLAVSADESAETVLADDEALLAFAQCMRDQGLDFADPTVGDDGALSFAPPGGGGDGAAGGGFDREAFQAGGATCGTLIEGIEGIGGGGRGGGGGGEIDSEAFLLFAECMRANGVAAFPDPGTDGRPDREAIQAVDFTSAEVQAANETCTAETGTEFGGGGRGPGGAGGRGGAPGGDAPAAGGDA